MSRIKPDALQRLKGDARRAHGWRQRKGIAAADMNASGQSCKQGHVGHYVDHWRNGSKTRRCQRCADADRIWRTYKLTWDAYERLVKDHGGKCGSCGAETRLAIDHNHTTMRVRGLLCIRCNVIAGYLEKNAEQIDKVKSYLERMNDGEDGQGASVVPGIGDRNAESNHKAEKMGERADEFGQPATCADASPRYP